MKILNYLYAVTRHIYIVIFILAYPLLSFAQTDPLTISEHKTIETAHYNRTTQSLKNAKDSFLSHMNEVKKKAYESKSLQELSYYNFTMATYYSDKVQKKDSANWYAQKNILLKDSLGYFDRYTLKSIYLSVNYYNQKQNFGKIYTYLIDAYKSASRFGKYYSLKDSIIILDGIVSVLLRIRITNELKPYAGTLTHLINHNQDNLFVKQMGNSLLASVYKNLENDSSWMYYHRALSYHIKDSNKTIFFFQTLNSMVQQFLKDNQTDSARKYIDLYDQYNHYRHGNNDRHHLEHKAHYQYLIGNPKEAIRILQPLYELSTQKGDTDFVYHISLLMTKFYAQIQDYKKAYEHAQEYIDINEFTLSRQENSIYSNIYLNMVTSLKDDIEDKALYIQLQEKTLQLRSALMGISVIGFVFLGFIIYSLRRNLRLKEKFRNEELDKMNTQHVLEKLESKITGIEEERKRLAIDLHDGIANELWALQMQLQHFAKKNRHTENDTTHLEHYQEHLQNVIEEVRNTAKNLRPNLLIQSGLESAVQQLCERFNSNQSKIVLSYTVFQNIPRFEEKTELSIYRIIQELVQNALKHAKGADSIAIQMNYVDKMLMITIEDNGKGIDQQSLLQNSNNGLSNIYDRAKVLNGEVSYSSYPNQGTCFSITFFNLTIYEHHV